MFGLVAFLVYLLVFFLSLIFVAHWTTLGFWASCLGMFLFFFFLAKCVKQICLPCRNASNFKGSKLFLGFSLDVLLRDLSIHYIVSFLYQSFDYNSFLSTYLHVGFWKTLEPMLFRLPTCPFSVLIGFFLHFSWGD
jgi:hypothetical protein